MGGFGNGCGGCGGSGSGVGPGPGSGRWKRIEAVTQKLSSSWNPFGPLINTGPSLHEFLKSLQVLFDMISNRGKKIFFSCRRSFTVVKQLKVNSCAACAKGLEGDNACNVVAMFAFPCDPLVRRKIGNRGVPLFRLAGEFCFPMEPLIVERNHVSDALHEAGKIFKPSPLAVNPIERSINFN
jgi:hypothetical protein